ncbi:sigma-70 family RNA polymerase sigma factor [Kineococcus sp. NBC_00420]|uniref:RNA polymerase sigma factor n=1 Tax=Kineococcus sp. NBC_00420 TaxID=2903564 RepID=UPI002E1EEA6C
MRADDVASRRARSDRPARSFAGTAAGWGTGGVTDDAGYQTLFEQHFHPTVRLARLLGADDPEDIAQEAFVRLHRHHHRLHESNSALAYLRRTTANLTTSRLRHLRVVHRTPGDATRVHASAEDSALAAERVDHLLAAVQRLPRRQRHALILRYWMDLPVAEVAEALQIPVGTAKSDISRAQRTLATRLEDLA